MSTLKQNSFPDVHLYNLDTLSHDVYMMYNIVIVGFEGPGKPTDRGGSFED